jgi:DNA-binding SARP family transcriptional activator
MGRMGDCLHGSPPVRSGVHPGGLMGLHGVARPAPSGPMRQSRARGRTPSSGAFRASLELLGGFYLAVDGETIHLPRSECRVLASVALRDRALPRAALAGQLWPDTTSDRALGRLRTALWRLRRIGRRLVDVTAGDVALGPLVAVDVRELIELSHRLSDAPTQVDEERLEKLGAAGELLPDWDDEWLVAERERIRQMRLHALEYLSEQLAHEGRFGLAVEAALTVIADDPLRESARRTLIRVHMAEGNLHDALAQYTDYRNVMKDDLGLDPSPQMDALLQDLGISGSVTRGDGDGAVTVR